MKTNIITNNTIMRTYMKYLCAVLMIICTSAHAWGAANIADGRYELVTDVSTLNTSDSYIIAGSKSGLWAMQPYSSGNNCSCVKILSSFTPSSPETSITLDGEEGAAEFTLGGSASGWSIYDGQNYYYTDGAALSGQNYLKGSGSSSVANSLWTIASPGGGSYSGQVHIQNTTNTYVPYIHLSTNSTPKMSCYNGAGAVYLYKKIPTVTLHEGVGGTTTSTIAVGDHFPSTAADVPGWYFTGNWATAAHSNEEPDYPSGAIYDSGDASTSGTYYAIYQGSAYGCNYGDYSCKPAAIYIVEVTNASSGAGVNWVVADAYCGSAGTTVTLTLTINEPGTSYQGATIVRDDNGQAVPFTYDDSGADPIITFDLPASDVTATVNFECPDISGETVTIPTITPVYNTSTSKWEATAAWNAVDGATNYKVQLGNRTTETVLTSPNPTVVTTTSYTNDAVLKNLMVDNEYRLMVQAYNSCDASKLTAYSSQDFTPHCADLEGTLAISLDEVGSTNATLSWSGATTPAIQTTAGANSSLKYDVQITRTLPLPAESTGGTLDASDVTYTSWEGTGLTTGATYRIDVTAKNACGETMEASRTFKCKAYENYQFTCADLSLSDEDDTHAPIWITSTAGKMVRSQKALHIEGTGLKPNGAFTFTIGGVAANNCASGDVFAIRQADGSAVTADASGDIDMDVYVFYKPSVATDGVDLNAAGTEIVATSASGTVPPAVREYNAMSATLANVAINGRHLPTAGFVIAGKKDNKWYALPATMASIGTPDPSEIAVDDINNPSIAYTAASNIYTTEGPTAANISGGNGQYIRFVMMPLWVDDADHSKGHAPLFGAGDAKIGKSGDAQATNNLSAGWWWALTQTNTSVTNPQDAKYSIKCANSSNTLRIKNSPFVWGQYASGVEELRLIPASDVTFTEAYFVEWAQHGGVVEVDATAATGVDATSVVAHLGAATSAAIDLVQTKAGDAKNKTSKYNYTVNFGDGIDFAAAASNGAMLTLEWKNGATTKAVSNIVVPKIVASNITINKANYPLKSDWNTEVHVLPGKTVTVDPSAYDGSNVTIKELNIYPGATVIASTGTLIATNLVLRNGWSRAGAKTYDVARLYVTASTATLKATNVYADWYIDYDQYYPIAVPWNATVENFTYRYCTVEPSVGPSANIRLRYYDGASRATNVQEGVGSGANWKEYGAAGNTAVPATLTPSNGYVMTAKRPTGKAFSIIRMPLTLPSGTWGEGSWTTSGESGAVSETHKDQIAVTAWGVKEGSNTAYAEGWNLIANPYMSIYRGTISLTPTEGAATTVNFVNIPDVDFKEYDQRSTATATLKPASAFLIQAPKTGTITFGTANRKASAPSYRREETESVPEQQAYILLNGNGTEDQMGILVSDKYTAEYELNADLEKLLSDGTSLRTYMQYCDRNMAYVAINEMLAKEWIPVTVRIPAEGEYTFSMHEASIADELEGVYLTDYLTGATTNLLYDSYTFTAEAGTISDRFAINAIIGEHKTPTGIDAASAGADIHSDKPFKFVYRDKVYILHRGVIYDATGKLVSVINK